MYATDLVEESSSPSAGAVSGLSSITSTESEVHFTPKFESAEEKRTRAINCKCCSVLWNQQIACKFPNTQ